MIKAIQLLFFFLSCVLTFSVTASTHAEEVVTIGLMAELTGQFARMGEDCRRGYQVAQTLYAPDGKVGQVPVRFILGDNRGQATAGLSEFRRLVDVEQAVTVVTTRSPVGLAVNPVSHKKGIPLVGIVGHPQFTRQNKFAFQMFPTSTSEGEALAHKAIELNTKRAAVLTLEDDYFLALTEGFQEKLRRSGGEIVFSENVFPGDQDFATILQRLLRADPQAILVNLGPAQAGLFVRKLREHGFTGSVFSNFLLGIPDALKNAGEAAEGAILVEVDFAQPVFITDLEKQFGDKQSSPVGYSCFVGLSAVLQALASASGVPARNDMYNALLAMEEVELPDTAVPLVNRRAQLKMVYRIIKNGRVSGVDS